MNKEQANKLRKQLLDQLERADIQNKEEIVSSIESMDDNQLEEFLKENKLLQSPGKCIFCSIVDGESDSIKIGENEEAVAILEINPASKGHSLVIPKIHSKEISKKTLEIVQEVAEKLKTLTPTKIDVIPKNLFGHEIINILPIYNEETLDSERIPANPQELLKIQRDLSELEIEKTHAEPKKTKEEIPISRKTHRLPKRIP